MAQEDGAAMMSKSEISRVQDLERRVKELEKRIADMGSEESWRDPMSAAHFHDEIGADHKEHVAAFPKKTLTLKAKSVG